MSQPSLDALKALLEHATDRGFGDAVLRTNLAARPFHSPLREGAANLLDKATHAVVAGDQAKADRLIARVLKLPYDDLEECDTALHSAHMAVFNEVTDLLEASLDDDDERWLDAAESVLENGSEGAREHLLRTLDVVRRDYNITKTEERRIRAAQARHPQSPSDDDTLFLPPDALLPEADRERYVRSAVEATVAVARAYEALLE